MKHILYVLGVLLLFSWQPLAAQDGCDDEIEIGGCGPAETEQDEEELKKTRKKNVGLAGGTDRHAECGAQIDDIQCGRLHLEADRRFRNMSGQDTTMQARSIDT